MTGEDGQTGQKEGEAEEGDGEFGEDELAGGKGGHVGVDGWGGWEAGEGWLCGEEAEQTGEKD